MGLKISELNSASESRSNDLFVIVQNNETKKITKDKILEDTDEQIELLKEENEFLKETLNNELSDGTATGESIVVNDSAEYYAEIDVSGNSNQITAPTPSSPQEVQVVKGSNTIKVSNKNWFDKDNTHSINAYISTSIMKFALSSTVKTYWIACQPNTTYTIQKILSKQFRVGTSNGIPSVDSSLLQAFQNNDITQYTITTDSQAKYLCINIRNSSNDTLTEQEILDSIQIEKGSTATDYVEHEEQNLPLTLPEGMEMCKIEDYKDKFVKDLDSGKWYKKEIIEKDVLDGNEVWNKNTGTGYEGVYYSPNKSFVANLGFCDIYSRFNNYNAHDYAFNTNGGAILIKNKDIETVADFKNALKNKNATTYFVRINPQLIEITDETLISQLEELLKVKSYFRQTNITVEAEDLEPMMNFKYKRSNELRLEALENNS